MKILVSALAIVWIGGITLGVSPEPVHTLGTDTVLYQVVDADVEGDEVWVLTQPAPAVHHFKEGRLVQEWGREGRGPGELTDPRSIDIQGREIGIVNLRPNRAVRLTNEGRRIGSVPVTEYVMTVRGALLPDAYVVEAENFSEAHSGLLVVRDGTSTRSIDRLNQAEVKIEPDDGPSLTLSRPFVPRGHWTLTSDDRVVYTPDGSVPLRILDPMTGEQTGTLDVPDPGFEPSQADLDAWLRNEMNPNEIVFGRKDPFQKVREKASRTLDVPDTFPPVLDLKSDDTGGVWVLQADRATGQTWTRLHPDAEPSTITLPQGRRLLDVGTDRLAAHTRTDEGVELVEVYRLGDL